ncbi:MAG: tetratricopeptide repeat protein, partial [Nostoc sp.]|uniref:tetratricopeptide repeat protein n=1 Tax=Nostoc sp. TaxID=1180 RepID=UPI002FF6EAA1
MEFVGREEELQKLDQLLQENKQVAIAAIAGMGGVGKTELALQYALSKRDTYQGGTCWLLTKTGDVGIQVVQFARTQLDLNPPEDFDILAQLQYCWRRWREGDVLLVLDDVTDYEQVKPYFQSLPSRFKVLITTRQNLGRIAQLSLDTLQPEAALELLRSLLKETPQRIERELAVANQLCEWLGYLPLGLELVGRYLARKPDLSLAEMLRRLDNKRLDERSLSKSKSEADMTAQRGVLAAFELSWQELEDDDKQLGCLLSLFAAAPIPWNLVEQCLPESDAEDLEEIRDDKLLNLHLLQRKSQGIYQLHPLLREFFQYKLTGLEQAEEFKRALCRVMLKVAKKIPDLPTQEFIRSVKDAIPHLAEVAKNLTDAVSDENLIWPFSGLNRFYSGQGLYALAEPWKKLCLSVIKKRLGEEHPSVAVCYDNLAKLYTNQGRYSEAESLYQKALELFQRLLGEEHPSVAICYDNLAKLYTNQGRYLEAEPLHQKALELFQRLLGEEHPSVAICYDNLAKLYTNQGRYLEAEPLHQKALELFQRLLGEEHPSVAICYDNLAKLYTNQRRYSEAEPLHQKALLLRQRLLGEEHPSVAICYDNLAKLYTNQGRYSEAESLYQKVLLLRQRLLGEEHPDVAVCYDNLAVLYTNQGRYSEAEPLHQKALELFQRLLGEEHPSV